MGVGYFIYLYIHIHTHTLWQHVLQTEADSHNSRNANTLKTNQKEYSHNNVIHGFDIFTCGVMKLVLQKFSNQRIQHTLCLTCKSNRCQHHWSLMPGCSAMLLLSNWTVHIVHYTPHGCQIHVKYVSSTDPAARQPEGAAYLIFHSLIERLASVKSITSYHCLETRGCSLFDFSQFNREVSISEKYNQLPLLRNHRVQPI